MKKAKKILFITTAMTPFVPDNATSTRGRYLPQYIQELGHEIRTFTPKWGVINERRNQLHEVIRLSGMNLIIDETDHPLVIKVASLASAHMQIYFIDNDDYFQKRREITEDEEMAFEDNGERAIFFARGVLETVKKLRWMPDIIHCYGWISALAPLYIKRAYQDEPSFSNVKVVFSATKGFEGDWGEHSISCIPFRDVTREEVDEVCHGKLGSDELQMLAARYSDGLVLDDAQVSQSVIDYATALGRPILPAQDEETFAQATSDFYETLL